MKDTMKKVFAKVKKYGLVGAPMALALSIGAFAAEGDPVAGTSAAMTVITAQLDALKTDGVTIIGAAIGLGALFFGAKFLWGKFRSMAK